ARRRHHGRDHHSRPRHRRRLAPAGGHARRADRHTRASGGGGLMCARPLSPARLGPADVIRVGGAGLRSRPLRVLLSALGIAIGIAAMLAVVGISASSQEQLNRELAALGTNLLTASPGQTLFGKPATLPAEAI